MRKGGDAWSVTDGIVTVRPPRSGDADLLIAGRDAEFHRWLGPGSSDPRPTACITIDGEVVGWVDFDHGERTWLETGEVNIGYHLFAAHRGAGLATRAVRLLIHHLALEAEYHTASVLIDPENVASLGVAVRCGMHRCGTVGGSLLLKRPIPPTAYSDGVVGIRRQSPIDLARDLEAKDAEQ